MGQFFVAFKNSDKFLLLTNKKLNSDHMEAVNIFAWKQYQNILGLQLIEKVPEYIKKNDGDMLVQL